MLKTILNNKAIFEIECIIVALIDTIKEFAFIWNMKDIHWCQQNTELCHMTCNSNICKQKQTP